MFRKVLVANRGEIAVRIIRTLHELGVRSVAAFSEADRRALFVELADEAYLLGAGPAVESYLNIAALLEVAALSHADAVHPGYGFLAENASFARAVLDAGLTFIGPSPNSIELMGDKLTARQAASRLGVPLIPGTPEPVRSLREAQSFVEEFGLPVTVKAAAGGGGRGIHVVRDAQDLESALVQSGREAASYFKNSSVFLERYLEHPRHVEIQVLADQKGTLIHLGERDCSLQRKHQKLIEEAPSPAVDRQLRTRMGEMALRVAEAAQYCSAGTVEFLLDQAGCFYFLEMNTRVQVEHPVTEMVTGTDLIREMVLVAAGEPLSTSTSRQELNGHAIEVRINAEDPHQGFRPSISSITEYVAPGGPGVRVDSGIRRRSDVPQFYDSLLAKLVSWAPDREVARLRALRALAEYRIDGPTTTIDFARTLLQTEAFRTGRGSTTFVEDQLSVLLAESQSSVSGPPAPPHIRATSAGREFEVEVNRKFFVVRVSEVDRTSAADPGSATTALPRSTTSSSAAVLMSPMHGTVLSLAVAEGDPVELGQTVAVIEAMKMENDVTSHRAGRVQTVHVATGDTVETNQPLITFG